jgi:hypothetical protein
MMSKFASAMAALAVCAALAVPAQAQAPRDQLKVVQARGVPVGTGVNNVARLVRIDAAGATVWQADTWVGYSLKAPGEYHVAVVRDQALVRFPLGPDERYYKAPWSSGRPAVRIRASDPLVREADSTAAWSEKRIMPFDPPLTAPAQGVEP